MNPQPTSTPVRGDTAEWPPALLAGAGTVARTRPVAFMFPGLGDQYVGMGLGLYREFPVFRGYVDHCATLLAPELGVDIREVLFPDGLHDIEPAADRGCPAVDLRHMLGRYGGAPSPEERRLNRVGAAHPALFTVEYALAKLWESWGVRPGAVIGYSLGEYVAACLAGVLSLTDALALVARRARLVESSAGGAMLTVLVGEDETTARLLGTRLFLSAVNGPDSCVVAGAAEDVGALEAALAAEGIGTRRVRSAHAFHSPLMAPLADELTALTAGLTLNPPSIRWISTVTGRSVTPAEATDPAYWARHMCVPVRFADALGRVLDDHTLLEVGPGQALTSLAAPRTASRTATGTASRTLISSMRHPLERHEDIAVLLGALGHLTRGGR